MRKIFIYSLAPTLLTSLPVLSAVACANKLDEKDKRDDWEIIHQQATEINLNRLNGIEDFFKSFNSVYQIFMPELATKLLAKPTPATLVKNLEKQKGIARDSYEKFIKWAHNIKTQAVDLKISYTDGDQTWEQNFDMSEFRASVLAFKKDLKSENYHLVTDLKTGLQDIVKTFWNGDERIPAPNMIAIAAQALGISFAINFSGFTTLPGETRHHFFRILDSLHAFSKQVTDSTVWKKWSAGKKYQLILSKNTFSNQFADFHEAIGKKLKTNLDDLNAFLTKQALSPGEKPEQWADKIHQAINEFLKPEVERFGKTGLKADFQVQVKWYASELSKVDKNQEERKHKFNVWVKTTDPYKEERLPKIAYKQMLTLDQNFKLLEVDPLPSDQDKSYTSKVDQFKGLSLYEVVGDGAYGQDQTTLELMFENSLAVPKDLTGLNNFEAQLMFNIVNIYSEAD
ncbi:hypothetical protein [Mycoplasma sp. ATU-Cv-508]|uniref:hypothetical protein n=1 Tax=Mycoplasma sp. ATU-Cv-508 TaxID=2048001 RepID=UPI000FDF0D26